MHFINYDQTHLLNDFNFREIHKRSCNFKCFIRNMIFMRFVVRKQNFGTWKINDQSILNNNIMCFPQKPICLVDFALSNHLFVFSFLLASEEVCPSITTFMFDRTCFLCTRRYQSPSKSHRFVSQLSAVVIFCFNHVIPDRIFPNPNPNRLIKNWVTIIHKRWVPGFNE